MQESTVTLFRTSADIVGHLYLFVVSIFSIIHLVVFFFISFHFLPLFIILCCFIQE